jgi:Na+/citrate or Na+/malate symporter
MSLILAAKLTAICLPIASGGASEMQVPLSVTASNLDLTSYPQVGVYVLVKRLAISSIVSAITRLCTAIPFHLHS